MQLRWQVLIHACLRSAQVFGVTVVVVALLLGAVAGPLQPGFGRTSVGEGAGHGLQASIISSGNERSMDSSGSMVRASTSAGPTGTTWTYLTQGEFGHGECGPADGGSIAYDAATGYVLHLGGWDDCDDYAGTAIFQNGSWTNLSGSYPDEILGPSMAYDAPDGYVLLYGGNSPYGCLNVTCNETWEFKDGVWSELDPRCYFLGIGYGSCAPLPTGMRMPMVYDAADGYVLLDSGTGTNVTAHGDFGPWAYSNDTWTYLGENFSTGQIYPSPPSPNMAYDALDGYVIAFGGETPGPAHVGSEGNNYTWKWSGGRWLNITANVSGAPPPRISAGITYDSTDGYVLLYGGLNVFCSNISGGSCERDNHTSLGDTWSYSDGTWTELTPSSFPGYIGWLSLPLLVDAPADHGVIEYSDTSCSDNNCSVGGLTEATWYWGNDPPVSNTTVIARGAVDVGVPMNLTAGFNGGTAPFSVQWAFGDGQTASGRSVVHTYTVPGSYNVTVWVNDSRNHHTNATLDVAVYAGSAASAFASPSPTDVGLSTGFNPGILGGYPQYEFNWSFGDGNSSVYACGYPCSQYEGSTSYSYSRPGDYKVNLSIRYSNGAVVNESFGIVVNVDPTIVALTAAPNPAILGQPVTFNSSVTGGTPPYTYSWMFGDGGTGGNLGNITHIYTTNGPFVATLVVSDAADWGLAKTVNISIELSASVTANATLGAAPLVTGFASEVLGGVPGYTYSWEFGDGGTSAGANPSHVYANPGLYHVTLLVTDAEGHTATATWEVQVFQGGGALQLGAQATKTTLTAGQTTNITLAPSGGSGNYTITWTSIPIGCVTIFALNLSCTPTENGTYTVSAEVTDARGDTASTYVTYTVGTNIVTITVTFVETGLPSGTGWSVTLNGMRQNSSTDGIGFEEPKGEYTFLVGTVAGYAATPTAGNLMVNDTPVDIGVQFTPIPPGTYPVIFAETGLASGTMWSVTLNGAAKSTGTGYLVFAEPNGTYSFTIASVSGYSLKTISGMITVKEGAPITTVAFTPVKSSTTPGLFGLPGVEGYLALAGILAAIVVVALVGFFLGRRRRGSSERETRHASAMTNEPQSAEGPVGLAESEKPHAGPPGA